MIGRLKGILIQKNPPTICVDVNGVGYDCDVPMSTFYELPELNQEVVLYTHLAVREDAHLLFAFKTEQERATFRLLLKVSGIGARTALSILSGMNVDELQLAIHTDDVAKLQKIPGIGKKTAERLLVELRGKFGAMPANDKALVPSTHTDVLNALLALGYSEKEAKTAMKSMPNDHTVEESIRWALKQLAS
ncbi:Holliday junction branch migration protein RuvA [Basilea psittacipulmonis]|uniref:Holliday junction branch migration complex subunit RuvA n=1 Tax=Basilea psittacipulmonis DSM 24701 TaxID=1072685 RepID=A0A077DFY4_9BURK|nr:Holliday junction branch migration protein RuvA [Basilea psittacipulmonis]AIL33076.1 ATP-dependent DNA helicase RuvA [Basilea psittacipulmonis DSM 24701]